jgi:hypothetical protein
MATKQGLTASLYQQTEDAKRRSKWFSNLNTTCTIKSAPPRTPEVLQLLASKSGYLLKRNEQHVWQSRWCCVVPHHFLYYFDDGMVPQPTAEQQEALNAAVGRTGRKHAPARSSLNIFSTPTSATPAEPFENAPMPAGIIDLECYTSVHRSEDHHLLELAGDETLNPDLRSFYFVAENDDTGEEWTRALLSGRHSALLDEREAYRQVCDGFSEQLQELHASLDSQSKELSDARDENYRIRSLSEETRRLILRKVQQVLEKDIPACATQRRAFRTELETVRNQDLGGFAAVQLLSDYTNILEEACMEWMEKEHEAQERLRQGADLDHSRTRELEELLQQKEEQHTEQVTLLEAQFKNALDRLVQAQTTLQEKQQQAQSQKMEFSMYQSSMKAKLLEVNGHKKILKKEVIDLRIKLDEVGSELSLLKHNSSMSKEQVDIERRKSEILEKYVEKMESQVKVQQNMMEIMSQQSGYGGGGGSVRSFTNPPIPAVDVHVETNAYGFEQNRAFGGTAGSPTRNSSRNHAAARRGAPNTPSSNHANNNMDDDSDDGIEETHSQMLRKAMADEDNKSHMSELTEDRTQKHWDYTEDSTALYRKQVKLPPSFIGVDHLMDGNNSSNNHHHNHSTNSMNNGQNQHILDHRDTINSSAVSLPTGRTPSAPRPSMASGDSVSSSGRLSVAGKARLDAERGGAVVPIRLRVPLSGRSPQRPRLQPSFLATLGQQLSDAIDNSVLGVPDLPSDDDDRSRSDGESDVRSNSDVLSDTTQLSLSERQQFQRAKQIAFLKEQGLLKNAVRMKGGAGAASPSKRNSSDGVTSPY